MESYGQQYDSKRAEYLLNNVNLHWKTLNFVKNGQFPDGAIFFNAENVDQAIGRHILQDNVTYVGKILRTGRFLFAANGTTQIRTDFSILICQDKKKIKKKKFSNKSLPKEFIKFDSEISKLFNKKKFANIKNEVFQHIDSKISKVRHYQRQIVKIAEESKDEIAVAMTNNLHKNIFKLLEEISQFLTRISTINDFPSESDFHQNLTATAKASFLMKKYSQCLQLQLITSRNLTKVKLFMSKLNSQQINEQQSIQLERIKFQLNKLKGKFDDYLSDLGMLAMMIIKIKRNIKEKRRSCYFILPCSKHIS